MKAIKVMEKGGPEVLKIAQIPIPQFNVTENETGYALIKVAATALNRADTLERKGAYPIPKVDFELPENVLGLEAAGVVEATSNGDKAKWKKGDKVMALLVGGGYAEYCIAHQDHLMSIPKGFSFIQAAAIPEVWLTAYQLLHFEAKIKKGETILVHAGGSAVGTALTQLIWGFGAKSIITAGTNDKLEKGKELHADYGINYKTEDFLERVKEITNGRGVDVILDPVGGGDYVHKNLDSLAMDGRWILYGMMGGGEASGPILGKLLRKRGRLIATTLRNRSDAYKAELVSEFQKHALPLFEQGVYKPIIDEVFPLEKASEAHTKMESNANNGKLILEIAHL